MDVLSFLFDLSEESIVTICCAAVPALLGGFGLILKFAFNRIRSKKKAMEDMVSRITSLIDQVNAVDEDLHVVEKDLYLYGNESTLLDITCSSCEKVTKVSKDKFTSGTAYCRHCGQKIYFDTYNSTISENPFSKTPDMTNRNITLNNKIIEKFKKTRLPTIRQMRAVLEIIMRQIDAVDKGLGVVETDIYSDENTLYYQITCPVCQSITSFGTDDDISGIVYCENCGKQMETKNKDTKESKKERKKKDKTDIKARFSDIEAAADKLQQQLDAVDEDLGKVEKDLYSTDSDNGNDEIEYTVSCPTCNEVIAIDVALALKREVDCPNCGEKFELGLVQNMSD